MSQSENKINVEEARENLQDALSLLIILENDLTTQQSDENLPTGSQSHT